MRKKHWNPDAPDSSEYEGLQEQGYYQTGSTKPPKSHSGLIAVLLVIVILLSGVITVLGLMNIQLFRQNMDREPPEDDAVCFNSIPPSEPEEEPSEASSVHAAVKETPHSNVQMHISDSPVSVPNVPQDGGLSLQEIYKKVIPSVISVSCSLRSGMSSGTGVVLSESGYIVTNAHVVKDAVSISVQQENGEPAAATLVGIDTISDLAVLYTELDGLIPAEFGDSSVLEVGDLAVAIGDPMGSRLKGTMTDGIISAINRDITTGGRTMTLIQTNAALNNGNSGGPLINCYGQVIGINTLKITANPTNPAPEGLGFAIPSTTVKEIVDQLIRQGYISGRPSLGISGEVISTFYQLYYRLPEGLYITEVAPDSDAAEKGLRPGDILISLDKVFLSGDEVFESVLNSHEAGDEVQAVIYRSGRQYMITLRLGETG